MRLIWKCIIGPKLYRIYNESGSNVGANTNKLENGGNTIIQSINVLWNIGFYTSPIIIGFLYKRNYFSLLGCVSLGKFAFGIGFLLIIGFAIRGIGRYFNPSYTTFLNVLHTAKVDYSDINKKALSRYDYDFWCSPVDFKVSDVEGNEKPYTQAAHSSYLEKAGPLAKILSFPCYLTEYFLIHLFGRHLIYPGSVHLLQYLLGTMLETGREKLITENNGIRNKILTRDGNEIDTMFIDRRNDKEHFYGSTLVVCCEGNAGYYEVGTVAIPMDAGYSVLGWNHPGFAGSSGKPFPSQDQHAIDAVMQFAIHKLKFQPQDIVIYAWSIGGYSASWAAMNYPQVKGVVLDATFDDILPLAIPRMPQFMSGLVKRAIRDFMNLNVAAQMCKYPGPVTIIRRTKDEIITTREGDISTNRGNNLLIKILLHRYPHLLDTVKLQESLKMWVMEDSSLQDGIYRNLKIDEEICSTNLISYIEEHGESYPMKIGVDMDEDEKLQMILFIAQKIFVNFNCTHNNPLDKSYFKIPWTPLTDLSYVQV